MNTYIEDRYKTEDTDAQESGGELSGGFPLLTGQI